MCFSPDFSGKVDIAAKISLGPHSLTAERSLVPSRCIKPSTMRGRTASEDAVTPKRSFRYGTDTLNPCWCVGTGVELGRGCDLQCGGEEGSHHRFLVSFFSFFPSHRAHMPDVRLGNE